MSHKVGISGDNCADQRGGEHDSVSLFVADLLFLTSPSSTMGNVCSGGGGKSGVGPQKRRGSLVSRMPQGGVKITNEKCPLIQMDAIEEVRQEQLNGLNMSYSLKYCFVSQRGYYPQSPNKANQDSYLIYERVCGDRQAYLFGIFDGHGEFGDYCSHYAATKLPDHLDKQVDRAGGLQKFENTDGTMEKIYRQAFVNVNSGLRKSVIDDSLSGTTGVTCMVRGDILYVANVGDSRAIIASRDPSGELIASPLSNDQTPFRKDERMRLAKKGAIIKTYQQIEDGDLENRDWDPAIYGDDQGKLHDNPLHFQARKMITYDNTP